MSAADLDWKALARKHEDRAKARAAEVDDLRAQLAEVEADAARIRVELARHEVALEFELPLVLITGSDVATMRARAERVVAYRVAHMTC